MGRTNITRAQANIKADQGLNNQAIHTLARARLGDVTVRFGHVIA